MGRMNDALRKAAEERERKRRNKVREPDVTTGPTSSAPLDLSSPDAVVLGEQDVDSPSSVAAETSDERAASISGGHSVAERARDKVTRERLRDEVEEALTDQTPSQGVDQRVISYHGPRDPRAEQMRGIRTTLLTMDSQPKSVAITSGSSDEGKSLACVNLAASLVEGGSRRVLLVDANLRHPQLCEIVVARDGAGLSDLMGGGVADPRPLIQQTGIPNVDLLPAGQLLDNPGSLLNPKALAGVLGMVEDDYDFVIVDTPALDEYADAAVMAPEVDGAILVCQVEGPPRSAAEKALDLLESARARVLGLMATNCR